jgi:putative flippase GtrA
MIQARETRPRLGRQMAGFVVVGTINAVLTFSLYLALLLLVPYWVALSLSFAAGIAFSLVANATFVFSRAVTAASSVHYTAFYVLNYVASLGVVVALVEGLRVPPALAPLCAIAVLLPINFLGSRWALRRKPP